VWEPLIPPSAVTIFSGGTEGVLSPHVTFIVKDKSDTGLLAAVGRTRVLEPHEIGTAVHGKEVSKAVAAMIQQLGVPKEDVKLVLIKCPLLTSAKLETIRAARKTPVTTDTYDSMAKSRYACAVGISLALGEMHELELEHAFSHGTAWSPKASCSSGAELDDCHILVLASMAEGGHVKAVSNYMKDAIDAKAVMSLMHQVMKDKGEVVQVFAKAEADPKGLIRGYRHTMNTDSDIHSTRHARAAVGGLIAGLCEDTQIYVSGGAEGQGPPGGGSLCIVYKCQPG
jgi:cyanuric acid amidohydrolase